jgi:hypothetical protein
MELETALADTGVGFTATRTAATKHTSAPHVEPAIFIFFIATHFQIV